MQNGVEEDSAYSIIDSGASANIKASMRPRSFKLRTTYIIQSEKSHFGHRIHPNGCRYIIAIICPFILQREKINWNMLEKEYN